MDEAATVERLTMTVESAARRLGISRSLAYQLAREGELPTIRLGRRILVPCAQLDSLLKESKTTPDLSGAEAGGRRRLLRRRKASP